MQPQQRMSWCRRSKEEERRVRNLCVCRSVNHFVAAMPPRKQIAGRPDRKQDLKSWLKREYKDPVKYQANVVRTAQPCEVLLRRIRSANPLILHAATSEGGCLVCGVYRGHAELWRCFCHLSAAAPVTCSCEALHMQMPSRNDGL